MSIRNLACNALSFQFIIAFMLTKLKVNETVFNKYHQCMKVMVSVEMNLGMYDDNTANLLNSDRRLHDFGIDP